MLLIGRDRDMERIGAALDRVGPGYCVVVEVAGEAGMGKSTLLDVFSREVQARGFACVRACGSRAEQDFAFGVLISLLDEVLAIEVDSGLLDPFDVADIAQVFPGLRSRVPAFSAESPVDLLLVCRAVGRALTVLAANGRGLALLIDDMHWVDEASRSVLGFLVRHGIGAPMLVATALRESHVAVASSRFAQVTAGPIEVIELGPIGDDEAGALLAGVPPAQRPAVLHAARGNPFFITQLATHARARTGADLLSRQLADSVYPPAVEVAIMSEMEGLTDFARRLAEVAAVLGDPFVVTLAGSVGGLTDDETYPAVDELLRRGLVVPQDTHGSFKFRHPIVANVIYDNVGQGWRLQAHTRAAQVLRDGGFGVIAVARHLEVSARMGDDAAIDLITAAAFEARALAPKTSIRFLEAALRLLPQTGTLAKRRLMLMIAQADCLIRTGQLAEGRQVLFEAIEIVPDGDHTSRAAVVVFLARVEIWLGEHDSGSQHYQTALQALPDGPSQERTWLAAMLVFEACGRGDLTALRSWTGHASDSAGACGQSNLVFAVAAVAAYGESQIGSTQRAHEYVEQAGELVDRLTANELAYVLEQLALLGSTALSLGKKHDALRWAQRGIELARDADNVRLGTWFRIVAEGALRELGRLASAAEMIDDAEQFARMVEDPGTLAVALGRRATLTALLGDLPAAVELAVEGAAYLELTTDPNYRAVAALSIAPLLLQADWPDRCTEMILGATASVADKFCAKPWRAATFEMLANASVASGDLDEASEWATRAADVATDVGLNMSSCCASRALAAVLIAADQSAAAVGPARAAVEFAELASAPIEAGIARMLTGRALVGCDQPADAVAEYQLALDSFEACGAPGLATAVRAELRSLGVRPAAVRAGRGQKGTRALSAREQEVAELVAQGLTNPQIADLLFLGRRTVESHLVRIFSKLGVTHRAEVGAIMRRDRIIADFEGTTDTGDESGASKSTGSGR